MGESNADPLYPTGAPAGDAPAQLGFPPAPLYRAVVERDYYGEKARHEAEAPTPEEARVLLKALEIQHMTDPDLVPRWSLGECLTHGRAHVAGAEISGGEAVFPESAIAERDARIAELVAEVAEQRTNGFAVDETWRKKHAALRGVLAVLVTEINALPQCFSCKANAGHFSDCPVAKARDLLEGKVG